MARLRRSKCAPAWTERRECLAIFFHVIDGKEMLDTVGTVLAGVAKARAEAIVVSGEMLKDLGGAFWNNVEWQVRVEDEAGNKVCALTFSADRQHLHVVGLPGRPQISAIRHSPLSSEGCVGRAAQASGPAALPCG